MNLNGCCMNKGILKFRKNSSLHKSLHKSRLVTNLSAGSWQKIPYSKCWN